MVEIFFFIFESIIFIPFAIWIIYFFVFSIGYRFGNKQIALDFTTKQKYLVLFPAYKEDTVIVDSVENFLLQAYPKSHYEVLVIADQLQPDTLERLKEHEVQILIPSFKKSSKAAAIKLALSYSVKDNYDAVVVLDADNHVDMDFLERVNEVYAGGQKYIQVHRVAKNKNTTTAYLDGLSEEINNSIFRKGHNNLGLPSALSGSGMIFEMDWFRKTMEKIDAVGEDKELEYYLLNDKIYTTYVEQIYVYDEKVSKNKDLSNQRKRWIVAQLDILIKTSKDFYKIISTKNWALMDKLIQWSMPPRILLIVLGPLFITLLLITFPDRVYKWILVYSLFLLALLLALPNYYFNKRTCIAFLKLPSIFVAILGSFIGLGSARTTFIHTPHGEEESNSH